MAAFWGALCKVSLYAVFSDSSLKIHLCLQIITKASADQKWGVSLANCMKIWRAGCIIQSDAICDLLLPKLETFGPSEPKNLLQSIPEVAKELAGTYQAVKKLYSIAIEADAVAPAVGATLEWMKAVSGKNLPTDFEEMELDCECQRCERDAG